jgi:AbrB family looped-hinge helix DNA binding protein
MLFVGLKYIAEEAKPMNAKKELVDITRTSKRGTSLRITLPKRIAEKLLIKEGEFVGFHMEEDKVIVERIA